MADSITDRTEDVRAKFASFADPDDKWMDQIDTSDGAIFYATGVFYYFKVEDVKTLFCKMQEKN